MAFKFPFTNYHELNLTWVLDQLKSLFEQSEENVTTIETYENRLTAVETELPSVSETASEASRAAAAAGTLAQTATQKADTAQENAVQAQGLAGTARNEAEAAQTAAQQATQAAQQAQATAQNFDGRITQAENDASQALEASRSFENRVQSAITTANNANQTATNAQGIAMRADQNAGAALDKIGDLSQLTTTAKNNLVAAINEAAQTGGGGAVTSVNGQTGAVVLDAGDIGYDGTTVETALDGKQNAPTAAGNAGQVLGLNSSLQPVWIDQTGGSGDTSNCAPLIINTASGAIASFPDGADNLKIRKIIGTIETAEGGTGWTGAKIEQRGKNFRTIKLSEMTEVRVSGSGSSPASTVLDSDVIIKNMSPTANQAYGSAMTTTITKSDDELSFTISNSGYGIGICVELPENASLKVYSVSNSGNKYVQFYNANKEFISVTASNITSFVTPAGTKYALFTFRGVLNSATTVSDFCIYADNSASYEPPKAGTTLTLNWETEAGAILNGTVTLNEDGSADIVNSDTGISYHISGVGFLNTFLGVNNIWIDTGSITEVQYPADTKLYIDNKIAELQALVLEH